MAQKSLSQLLLLLLSCGVVASAQTTVTTTNGGTAGTVPYFTSKSNIEPSLISQSSGTVSIAGPLSTSGQLLVSGQIISVGSGAGFRVLGGPTDDVNGAPWYGVGESNLNLWQGSTSTQNAVQVAGYFGLDFETGNGLMVMRGDNGNVGVGTTTPGSKLEINGNVKLTSGSGASVTYQDGSVQTVAWNGVLSGGDYAESVDVAGGSDYEPGDVLVVDPGDEGRFFKSTQPYSTAVTGVYSTRPGVVGRRQKTDKSHMKEEVPMAMTGIVPTKVCAENGPIRPGDLLVTSSKPGYAMKGTDRSQMLGAVIGKSLGHLDAGTGVIEVVITLQ